MEFKLLGPLEVSVGSAAIALAGRKQRALLARLLLDVNRTVTADRLVDDLWGENVPESAQKMVQIYVSQLRKVLPKDTLRTRPPGYAIEIDPATIDTVRFERLRLEGEAAHASGNATLAAARFREALSLWRGDALAEFPEPFARAEAARLDQLHLACLEARIDADLDRGRHTELVAELEVLVARYPLREGLRAQQLLALYRSGRQPDALAAYQAFRARLAEELGLEPSKGLRELELRILRQDPALDLGAPSPPQPLSSPRRTCSTSRAATSRSPTRWSATDPSISCSSTAGCAPSSRAGSALRSRASTTSLRLDGQVDPIRQARHGTLRPRVGHRSRSRSGWTTCAR